MHFEQIIPLPIGPGWLRTIDQKTMLSIVMSERQEILRFFFAYSNGPTVDGTEQEIFFKDK